MVTRRLGLLCAWLVVSVAAGASSEVQVTDSGVKTTPAGEARYPGFQQTSQSFLFSNTLARYGISFRSLTDPTGVKPNALPTEGYLGMYMPTSCNWYHSGFFFPIINGRDLGAVKARHVGLVEQGGRCSAQILWVLPEGQVRLRFLMEPGTDYLACELALSPTTAFKSATVNLRCYPSYFTGWNHRDGWRQIIGPQATVEQGARTVVNAAQNPWLLYQDKVFDCAKNSGDSEGPCGLAFVPDPIQALAITPGSYPVETNITLNPTARSVRFAFWEFPKVTNAAALARLQQTGPAVVEHLRQLDFGNRTVTGFDATREQAELDKLINQSSDPAKWRKTMQPFFDKITTGLSFLKGGDMVAELAVTEAIGQYREKIWDLKFDALLNG